MEARRRELVQRAGTGKEPASGEPPKSSGDTGFWNGGTLTEGEKLAGYTADWSKWRGVLARRRPLSCEKHTARTPPHSPRARGLSARVVEIAAAGRSSSANIVWSSLEISEIPIRNTSILLAA